jgi:hypothetical protein
MYLSLYEETAMMLMLFYPQYYKVQFSIEIFSNLYCVQRIQSWSTEDINLLECLFSSMDTILEHYRYSNQH